MIDNNRAQFERSAHGWVKYSLFSRACCSSSTFQPRRQTHRSMELFVLGLLTSLPVAPFSAAVTAAAAVTAEATSGRARRADGKHRRKAQTRRRARGELASYTNASSTASLSDSSTRPAVGMCRATRNDPGHCESGLSGSWTTSRSHGITDLEQCAARCRLCAG